MIHKEMFVMLHCIFCSPFKDYQNNVKEKLHANNNFIQTYFRLVCLIVFLFDNFFSLIQSSKLVLDYLG